jgi:hypothetical protein
MKKIMFFLYLGLATTVQVQGQSAGVCGNGADQAEIAPRLTANLAAAAQGAGDRNVVRYVPIHFHIVGDASGAGKLREGRILDQLCELNEEYGSQDIRFYFSEHPTQGLFDKSINNNNVYNTQTANFTMQAKRHQNALNVYVVNLAVSGNNTGGTTLAYYNVPNDWVVSRKDQINNSNNGTLVHEIGHFFSLMHTFYGWEEDPFTPDDPTWDVAPVISPGGVPTERQNGTNCTTAGDMICDTPPDYNFGFNWPDCDPYTLGAKDPLGTVVDPMETNFMGYFRDCGENYQFTAQQIAAVSADLDSPQRNYLDNNYTPPVLEIVTPSNLIVSPAPAEVTQYYDEVFLDWNPVTGANYYLLELDVTATFNSPLVQTFVLTESSALVTTLQANKTYQWRVRPFNNYYTCASPVGSSFKTSLVSATKQLTQLNAWKAVPNPVAAGQSLSLFFDANEDSEINILLMNAEGRVLRQINSRQVPAGSSSLDLPLDGVQPGFYMVVLQNEQGRDVRKVIVK